MKDISKELSRSKILMMGRKGAIFFSTICLSLETIVDDSIPTACTNGKYIKYNPDFFLSLTEEERIFLLAHETLHVVFLHMVRRKDRCPRLWNVAADYVINAALVEQGFTMIQGALYNKRFTDMTTEEVYRILENEDDGTEPQFKDIDDLSETLPPEELEKARKEIEGTIIRAKTLAELSGEVQLSKGIKRLLSELLDPKLPWQRILARYLSTQMCKSDYSWKRPKQRGGTYLPRLRSPQAGEIDVAIDVSGSVSAKDFEAFMAELFGILKKVKPSAVNVTQFDHLLRGDAKVKSVRDLQRVAFTGGGGTLASIAYLAFAEHKQSQLLVIVTDGGIHPHDTLPKEGRPVLWVIYNNPRFVAPNRTDKVIHFTL